MGCRRAPSEVNLYRQKKIQIMLEFLLEKHKYTCLCVDVKTELQSMWMGSNAVCELLPNQLLGAECPGHQMPYWEKTDSQWI